MDDWLDDSEAETEACPACGAEVYEEAEQCPECGEYITPGAGRGAFQGKPLWWVVLGLLGVVALFLALLL
jgi:predicted amidophosphoribosyltransferase